MDFAEKITRSSQIWNGRRVAKMERFSQEWNGPNENKIDEAKMRFSFAMSIPTIFCQHSAVLFFVGKVKIFSRHILSRRSIRARFYWESISKNETR